MLHKLTTKDKIILDLHETNFFLNLSIYLKLPFRTTIHTIKESFEQISKAEKSLDDFSNVIQKGIEYYKDYIKFTNEYILEINNIPVELDD